jgi:hypothetical protein
MSTSGRFLPVVTVRDFSPLATCYVEFNGRVRPKTDIQLVARLGGVIPVLMHIKNLNRISLLALAPN